MTRFYTTPMIYEIMERMHHFDEDLRLAFQNGTHQGEVTFIQKDDHNKIITCSPNKILLSRVITIKAKKRFLPVGFQTLNKTETERITKKIDLKIEQLKKKAIMISKNGRSMLVPVDLVAEILEMIHRSYVMEDGYEWDIAKDKALLNYLSNQVLVKDKAYTWVITRDNRNISRFRSDNERFADRPDNGQDELSLAYKIGIEQPTVLLLRQNGLVEQGWRGGAFYWPVIVAQQQLNTVVFSG